MKKKLFTLLTLLLCVCSGAWADEAISCSAKLSGTENAPTQTNCILKYYSDEGSVGKIPAGTERDDYYYSKMNGNSNYYELTLAQGRWTKFQAGDVIKVYLYTNSATPGYKVGKTAQTVVSASDQTKEKVYGYEHTLTAAEIESNGTIRIYRNSSNTYFAQIDVTGTRTIDTASPSIDTDLSTTPQDAPVNSPLSLTVTASHVTGYQWYSNTTASTEGAEAIVGATSATYTYTPTAGELGTTKYFYCVAINDDATGEKTATSSIATVNIIASNNTNVASVIVVANGKYTASVSETTYSATIGGTTTARVTITPEDDASAIVSSGLTVGDAGKAITVDATVGTPLSFTVTAGDGVTTKDYTVNVSKVADKTATGNEYYLAKNELIYGGQQIIADDITMTFSTEETGTYNKVVSDTYVSEIGSIYSKFVASTSGNNVNGSLTESGIAGCWYKFTPSVAGTLSVGAIVNGGKTLSISNGTSATLITEGISYVSNGNKTFDASWKANDKIYGVITIKVNAGTDYYFTVTGASKMGFYGFKFIPAETVTVGAKGYSTYVNSSKSLDFTGNSIKAYVAQTNAAENAITLTQVNKLAKNTPVLLYSETNSDSQTIFAIQDGATTDEVSENFFHAGDGTTPYTWADTDESRIYVLNTSATPGFYKANNSTVATNKAYLLMPSGVTARFAGLSFDDNETTGIKSMVNGQWIMDNVYDMQGRRVAQPQKGLYIVNGKKVVIK